MVICNDWLPIAKEAFMYVNLKPFFVHYSVSVLIKKFPLINSTMTLKQCEKYNFEMSGYAHTWIRHN